MTKKITALNDEATCMFFLDDCNMFIKLPSKNVFIFIHHVVIFHLYPLVNLLRRSDYYCEEAAYFLALGGYL